MTVEIMPMTIADYEEVYSLWSRSAGIGLSDADTKPAIQHYLDQNPGGSFVARLNGTLVGAVLCGTDRRRGFLHHLAVAAAQQGKGIGRLLVERCLQSLRRQGITKCHIFVYRDNTEGSAFWEKIGWKKRTELDIMSIDL
jgi:ribosomal protein S18 acetylase RimI-like enzyme